MTISLKVDLKYVIPSFFCHWRPWMWYRSHKFLLKPSASWWKIEKYQYTNSFLDKWVIGDNEPKSMKYTI